MELDVLKGSVTLNKPGTREMGKTFTYDSSFDDDSIQENVYNDAAFGLVESVLEGYNGMFTPLILRHHLCLRTDRMWKDPHHDGRPQLS